MIPQSLTKQEGFMVHQLFFKAVNSRFIRLITKKHQILKMKLGYNEVIMVSTWI